MSVLVLVLVLCFIAGVLYVVNVKGAAMNSTIRWLINAVLIIVAALLVLNALGIWQQVKDVQVPKL